MTDKLLFFSCKETDKFKFVGVKKMNYKVIDKETY